MSAALPHLDDYIEQLGAPETLEQAIAERNAWVESAAQFSRNEDYYRGLLDQIAVSIDPEAYTADDGSVYDTPVRAKLPELIGHRTAALQSIEGIVEAAEAVLGKLDELRPTLGERPTIAELEALLAAPGGSVEIKPDGSIHVMPREEIETLRAALATYRGDRK